jgi:translation initiation factor IF-2
MITKTPRLLEAAKEFNIGKDTLVAFLTDKGFSVTSSPSTKLTEQMYNALQIEFAQDKLAKRRSEEIALPKGSLLDSLRRSKEDLDISAKDKKEDPGAVEQKPKPKEEKPKEPEKPKEKKSEIIEEPAKPATKPAIPVTVAKEEPDVKTIVANKEEAVSQPEETTKKAAAKTGKNIDDGGVEANEPEHLDVKAPKIEGPNILGKINLDDLNLASRPKKGAAKKKDAEKKDAEKKPVKKEDKETASSTTAKAKQEIAEEQEPVLPQAATTPQTDVEEEDNSGKPEHIEMKAPKLEGPKIIGRIELPVSQPSGNNNNNRPDNREKRKRKRIPVEKKPETHKP